MSNHLRRSFFPESQKDIALLKQAATDAASDLSSSAATHAAKAGEHLKDLAGHVQTEGSDHFGQLKGTLRTVVTAARNGVADRPLLCIGIALGLGFLIGRGTRRDRD